VSGTSAVLHL